MSVETVKYVKVNGEMIPIYTGNDLGVKDVEGMIKIMPDKFIIAGVTIGERVCDVAVYGEGASKYKKLAKAKL